MVVQSIAYYCIDLYHVGLLHIDDHFEKSSFQLIDSIGESHWKDEAIF